jgi:hypothetical protein
MNIVMGRKLAGLGLAVVVASVGAQVARTAFAQTAHHVAACTQRQLDVAYLGALPGAGNDFGTIVIWNTSERGCRLTGPIPIAGLDRSGRLVTNVVSYRVSGDATLTAWATRPDRNGHVKSGERLATLTLLAGYRDDPRTGNLCTAHQVEPASWRLRLADKPVTVRNANPDALGRNITRDNGLTTCRGHLASASALVTIGPGIG